MKEQTGLTLKIQKNSNLSFARRQRHWNRLPRILSAALSLRDVITRQQRRSNRQRGNRRGNSSLTKRKECAFFLCRIPSTSTTTPLVLPSRVNCSNVTPSSSERPHLHAHTHGGGIAHQSVMEGGTSLAGRRQRRGRMKSFRRRHGEGITTPVGNVGLVVG